MKDFPLSHALSNWGFEPQALGDQS